MAFVPGSPTYWRCSTCRITAFWLRQNVLDVLDLLGFKHRNVIRSFRGEEHEYGEKDDPQWWV